MDTFMTDSQATLVSSKWTGSGHADKTEKLCRSKVLKSLC